MKHFYLNILFLLITGFCFAQDKPISLIGKWESKKLQTVEGNNLKKVIESHDISGERIYNFSSANTCIVSGYTIGRPTRYTYTIEGDFLLMTADPTQFENVPEEELDAFAEPKQAYFIKRNVKTKQLIFSIQPFNSTEENLNLILFKKR